MTQREFLRALEDQLEVPEGTLEKDRMLADVEGWDSMAGVLFIALADEKLGVNVVAKDLGKSKTVHDLLLLLGDRLSA